MIEGNKDVVGIIPVLIDHSFVVSDYFIESSYKDASGKTKIVGIIPTLTKGELPSLNYFIEEVTEPNFGVSDLWQLSSYKDNTKTVLSLQIKVLLFYTSPYFSILFHTYKKSTHST